MTLKLIDGFDNVSDSTKMAAKGWVVTITPTNAGASGTVTMATGRLGTGNCLVIVTPSLGTVNGQTYVQRSLPAAYTGFVCGFAFKVGTTPAANSEILTFLAGATQTVRVFLQTTNKLAVANSGGTIVATSATAFTTGSWYYVELKLVINGASGSVTIDVNGGADVTATTGNFGSTGVDSLRVGWSDWVATPGNSKSFSVDDLYLLDTSASPNNTFLGDVAVETIYPSAAGAHTQWTPDSGSNYARVNEHSGTYPDDNTSFVSTQTAGNRDSYTMDDLAILSGTVYGVQTNVYARKDNSGARTLCAVTRPVATDHDGTTQTLGTSYQFFTEIAETNPDTASAWLVSDINAAEVGVKLVA